jgi:5-methylcytosine-specific restriction endonuclease McrA
MKSVLQNQVLVLNTGWQACNSKTVQEIIPMLCTGVATALEILGEDNMRPVKWKEWVTLPIRPEDDVIHTAKLAIRAPTVIVLAHYSKFPKKRPKLNLRGVAARDGNKCAYTGKTLSPKDMTIDHVNPRARGGKHEWKNVVLADKTVNNQKGCKTNEEAGLKLLTQPKEPRDLPAAAYIHPTHKDHERFLIKK